MGERYAYENVALYQGAATLLNTLLRIELLGRIHDWLTKKAMTGGCTSSSAALSLCCEKVFLHMLPHVATETTGVHAPICSLAGRVCHEVGCCKWGRCTCGTPRKAMPILTCVGNPLQLQDNLFVTERVAIFREGGLRDDVTIQRCLLEVGFCS